MRSLAAALLVAAICLIASPAARAITDGISDSQGTFASCPTYDSPCSSPSGLAGFWQTNSFASLRSSARSVQSVRLPVTYDAVATWNGSTGCTLSNPYRFAYTDQGGRAHPAGGSWYDLLYGLQAAYADGLQPLVVIDGYTAATAVRAYDGSSAACDAGEPDPTTTAGSRDYYCGVRGIIDALAGHLPSYEWPHRWEAWNEPNGGCTYLSNDCAPSVCAQINQPASNLDPATHAYTCSATGRGDSSCAIRSNADGAATAACLWIQARDAIVQSAGHAVDEVAAGSFSFPSTAYLSSYAGLLANQGYHPGTWAVHDYGDPTASGWLGRASAQQLQEFAAALARQTAGTPSQLWVTESGVVLTDRDRRYGSFSSIPCPAGAVTAAPNTLGACVNGNENAQITGAGAFFDLASVTGGPPVTALYWYQFAASTGAWDSGLLDTQGLPRASYCVWMQNAPGACAGSAQATPNGP